MNVAESIKKLRESRDMTQEQLGAIAGVSAMAVSQWENGRAVPRMGSIQKMADYFNVPKSTIMGDEEQLDRRASLTPLEQELVDIMRTVTPEGQRQLMVFARGIAATYSKNNQVAKVV